MQLHQTRKIQLSEKKLSEKRRRLMDLAIQCCNDVAAHDWETLYQQSKQKLDPCKCEQVLAFNSDFCL
jgi:hypothetical protein